MFPWEAFSMCIHLMVASLLQHVPPAITTNKRRPFQEGVLPQNSSVECKPLIGRDV